MTTANFEHVTTVDDIREALVAASGDITRAAERLRRSRRHVMRLLAKHGLNAWACSMRQANGQPAKGRPRKIAAR